MTSVSIKPVQVFCALCLFVFSNTLTPLTQKGEALEKHSDETAHGPHSTVCSSSACAAVVCCRGSACHTGAVQRTRTAAALSGGDARPRVLHTACGVRGTRRARRITAVPPTGHRARFPRHSSRGGAAASRRAGVACAVCYICYSFGHRPCVIITVPGEGDEDEGKFEVGIGERKGERHSLCVVVGGERGDKLLALVRGRLAVCSR